MKTLIVLLVLCSTLNSIRAQGNQSNQSQPVWQAQQSGTTKILRVAKMTEPNSAWALGPGMRHTTDGGRTWTLLPEGPTDEYEGMDAIGDSLVWVYQLYSHSVMKSTNAGASWTRATVPDLKGAKQVAFANERLGFVIGGAGRISRSTDGGDTWQTREEYASDLNGIVMFDSLRGIAVGYGARFSGHPEWGEPASMIFTQNGGETWIRDPNELEPVKADVHELWGAVRLDDSTIIAASAVDTPQFHPLLVKVQLRSGRLNYERIPYPNGVTRYVNSGCYVRDGEVYLCGYKGLILHTIDWGNSWTRLFTPDTISEFYSIDFLDSLHGLVVGGNGRIFWTENAGQSWVPLTVNSEADSLLVYPNPASTTISVRLSPIGSGNPSVALYSITGRFVRTLSVTQQSEGSNEVLTCPIGDLPTGAFQLVVRTGNVVRAAPFLKQ